MHVYRSKTRTARKSSYIEVEVPIRSKFSDPFDLSLNPFAIAHGNKQINLLNIHYTNLDVLPAVPLPAPLKNLEWLSPHVGMMLSETEKKARGNPDQEARGALVNLKESIACIVLKYAGLQLDNHKDWSKIFALCNPGKGSIYTLFFVNEMKFDLPNHAVIIDACVVPLVGKIMNKLEPGLRVITNTKFLQIVTLDDEVRAWKLLLLALAERCRTWKHTDTCEYRQKGIPASLKGSEISPLCPCGKGKNLGAFGTVPEWRAFRSEATRVAIAPLFSFMEELTTRMSEAVGNHSLSVPPSGLESSSRCAKCGGPGKPTLRMCSVCKKTQYCSRECQKQHWKVHKKNCAINT